MYASVPESASAPVNRRWPGVWLLAVLLLFVCPFAGVTAEFEPTIQERIVDGYSVRFSAIDNRFLSDQAREEAVLEEHNLPASGDYGIVNVAVLTGGESSALSTVRADVKLTVRDIIGHRQQVEMQSANAQGMTSYVGAFEIHYGAPMRFEVDVRPPGAVDFTRLVFHQRFIVP